MLWWLQLKLLKLEREIGIERQLRHIRLRVHQHLQGHLRHLRYLRHLRHLNLRHAGKLHHGTAHGHAVHVTRQRRQRRQLIGNIGHGRHDGYRRQAPFTIIVLLLVDGLMHGQSIFAVEGFATFGMRADIGTIGRVRLLMPNQRAPIPKTLSADITSEVEGLVSTSFTVLAQMSGQVVLVPKFLPTCVACKRLFSSVSSNVDDQGNLLIEGLITMLALEWLLSRVNTKMTLESAFVRKLLRAGRANK